MTVLLAFIGGSLSGLCFAAALLRPRHPAPLGRLLTLRDAAPYAESPLRGFAKPNASCTANQPTAVPRRISFSSSRPPGLASAVADAHPTLDPWSRRIGLTVYGSPPADRGAATGPPPPESAA